MYGGTILTDKNDILLNLEQLKKVINETDNRTLGYFELLNVEILKTPDQSFGIFLDVWLLATNLTSNLQYS